VLPAPEKSSCLRPMNQFDKNILRLFDANLNRAQEGIRVIEEAARMLLDNDALTRTIKDIRHSLLKIVNSENNFNLSLIRARGSETDVLRDGETHSERTREDVHAVVRANSGRAQEALRALEEYSKLLYPRMSEHLKTIRFRLYDVEKSLILALQSHERANAERLRIFVIIDHELLFETGLHEYIGALIEEGAGTVAYRNMKSSDGDFIEQAGKVYEACRGKNVTTIIYDRLDCAMILGVDGFHREQSGMPLKSCRQITGYNYIIGYTETIEDSKEFKILNEADYVLVTTGDITAVKFSDLSKFVSNSSIPVLVQGDFTSESLIRFLDSGVTGFSVKPDSEHHGGILEKIRSFTRIIQEY